MSPLVNIPGEPIGGGKRQIGDTSRPQEQLDASFVQNLSQAGLDAVQAIGSLKKKFDEKNAKAEFSEAVGAFKVLEHDARVKVDQEGLQAHQEGLGAELVGEVGTNLETDTEALLDAISSEKASAKSTSAPSVGAMGMARRGK